MASRTHILRRPIPPLDALAYQGRGKRRRRGMSTHYMSLQERLDVLAFMAYMALVCGLLMLITAREGKLGRAWLWSLAFVGTSLLTDLLFWRLT